MKDAGRLAVYGRSGSGKTTRVKALLKGRRRVVVFDPMDEYGRLPGFKGARSLSAVLELLKKGWRSGFKIAYVPAGDFPAKLHHLAKLLWQAQAPYAAGDDTRKLTFIVEELSLGYPSARLPRGLDKMDQVILQGRHRGLEVIGVTQRPAEISATFRGNANEAYILALGDELDHARVLRSIGKEHEAKLRALQPHEFLHWKDNKIKKGKNK